MPSILYVITDLDVGGVPLHLLRLATGVRARGYSPVVVSLSPPGLVGDWLTQAGIEVRSCGATGGADWRVFERLSSIVREVSPDLVHAFLFHANLAVRVAGVLSGFPARRIVCEIQTVEIERTWHLLVDRITHRLGVLTIGNSSAVVEHLHSVAGIPRQRLRLVEGGVDVADLRSAKALPKVSLGVTGDVQKVLLWVGRMDPIKGLDTLIEAIARLRGRFPFKLLLVGDGLQRAAVEHDIARRAVGDLVVLLGQRADVPRLLQTADLFVFPSRTEGLPNALLEAMAVGLPVVTTDVPGCHDLIHAGRNGRLVPAGDAASLAGAIQDAFDAPDRTRDYALAAEATVGGRYTLEACVSRYIAIYDTICAGVNGGVRHHSAAE